MISIETILQYNNRYENGYDLDTDTQYNTWKLLKEGTGSQDTPLSKTKQAGSDAVSKAFKEVLQTPSVTKKKGRIPLSRTLTMPKHMTGSEFIELMEEKERLKQEEETMKEQRKAEREMKKAEREQEKLRREIERKKAKLERERVKQQKEEEREKIKQQKQEERERVKQLKEEEREKMKLRKEKEQEKKKEQKDNRKRQQREDKENATLPMQTEETSSYPCNKYRRTEYSIRCHECGGLWEKDGCEDWISCDHCEQWFHILCTNVDPDLSPEELENLAWDCHKC